MVGADEEDSVRNAWASREGDGWGDGKGATKRFYKTEDEGEYGYIWVENG